MTQIDDAFANLRTTAIVPNKELIGNSYKEINTINGVLASVKEVEESNSQATSTAVTELTAEKYQELTNETYTE